MGLFYILFSSIVLIVYGIWRLFYYIYAKKNYSTVIGNINNYYVIYSGGNAIKYPIISYYVNGVQYNKKGWGRVIMNKSWKVYFDPNDPSKCILDNGHGIAYIVIGIIFLIIYCLIVK